MSWEPLSGGDPLPGDPTEVAGYARGLTDTADLIAEQVGLLRRIADPANWVAETADAFRDQAQDLQKKISKAEGRYRTVGRELTSWSETLAEAQRRAAGLLSEAQEQQRIAAANPPPAGTPPETGYGLPVLTPAEESQFQRGQDAASEVDRLRGQLESLVEQTRERAWEGGRRIRAALDDGLGNSFWDRIQAFVSNYADVLREVAKWAGRVALVLGAIALVIVLLSNPAGWVVLIGSLATLGAALATTVSLVANSGLAMSNNGSWTAVAFDAVALATFGVGRWATKGGQAALAASSSRGATIAGSRASSASLAQNPLRLGAARFLSSNRFPAIVRNPAAGYVAGRNHTAALAENVARDLVTTPPVTSVVSRLLQGGDTAVIRVHAAQLLRQFPNVPDVTMPAAQAIRYANVSVGALAVGDLSATLKTALEPNLDNGGEQISVLLRRLVEAR